MDKNKMLIDATHPEETRVVAVRNGRVEEFDFESAARKLLRGNIYLAKVTRVEPSLQAAFIDYGGNRHGFLAFNEIHPDYYQIPIADRELLKQEEAEAEQRAEAEAEERARSRGPRRRRRSRGDRSSASADGQGSHRTSRDDQDQPSDIETFEDGYRTSGPSHDEDADDQPPAAQPYRHAASEENVLREDAVEAPQPDHVPSFQEPPVPAPGNDTAPPSESDQPFTPLVQAADEEMPRSGPTPPPIAYPRGTPRPTEPASEVSAKVDIETEAPDNGVIDDIEDDDDIDEAGNGNGAPDDEAIEQVATEDDALEEVPERPRKRARQYKIQEVIKRRQIMLVQVVKEERGNKGAALTTYISLAGRYTVLMPNTARGGGISRKITQPQDRKRLKAIAEELDVPEGMGLIIRTAGAARTKQEIKRDYEYLLRLWESVRDLTLSSTAPCLVYEEGNIIKRAIRDLYSKDFDHIVVAGESAHRDAQDFMEMLMPGSGSHVASYRAPEPLFARYGVERQLNALFSPYVTLRSGGYIVINQTEALVSVDVNSGKSTREFSIEETALNTNLEAAEEIARQLKLRDLAGLIVVDFIDMEEKRNNRAVERRLKDALRHDRARIQVGRISHFGLLEMSRQRLRAGILEGSTSQCPHCQGTGIIRSIESVALAVLRGLEDQLLKQPSSLIATATAEVALYILNHKRAYITEMERRHGVIIRVEASDRMQGANFGVERIATPATVKPAARAAVSMEWGFDRDDETADEADEPQLESTSDEPHEESGAQVRSEDGGSDEERRGRRRRRRRGRRDRDGEVRESAAGEAQTSDDLSSPVPSDDDHAAAPVPAADDDDAPDQQDGSEADEAIDASTADHSEEAGGEPRRRGRRRGRRGGRSRRREGDTAGTEVASLDDVDRHEWGVAEYARPGAEQPSGTKQDRATHALHLVTSVDVETREGRRSEVSRTAIVESIDSASGYEFSAAEAVRLAVTLAGGAPDPDAPAKDTVAAVATEASPEAPAVEPEAELPPAATAAEQPADTAPASAADERETAVPAGLEEPAGTTTEPVDPAKSTEPVQQAPETLQEKAEEIEARAGPAQEPQAAEPDDEPAKAPEALSNGHDKRSDVEPLDAHEENQMQREPVSAVTSEPPRPARRGWWQRRFGNTE